MIVDKSVIDLRQGNTKWPLRIKIRRALWNLCWRVLFRPSPRRLGSQWRQWLLRAFGAKITGSALVMPDCRILQPWELELGDGVAIGEQVEIYNYAFVKIGAMTVISQYSYLCTGTHDYEHSYFPLVWKPITVGPNCWLAADVFVAPGVTISEGAVIGARSVVTKDMPAWTVCAGHPCKPLKERVISR